MQCPQVDEVYTPLSHSTIYRAISLLAITSVAVSVFIATAPVIASAAPTGCPPTFTLFIPGTWETGEGADPTVSVGMVKPIADSIVDKHDSAAQVPTLPCMARAFDNGKTYADSKSDGLSKAKRILFETAAKCSNTKFTITGYSQGADIAGDLASEIGNGSGPIKAEQFLAVDPIANVWGHSLDASYPCFRLLTIADSASRAGMHLSGVVTWVLLMGGLNGVSEGGRGVDARNARHPISGYRTVDVIRPGAWVRTITKVPSQLFGYVAKL